MGITERREREKAERRKAILDSARELILSQGIQQLSMEDIARKAELSKATVYLYFSGKEALFNEICEEAAQIFLERFKPIKETGLTGIEALKQFWRSYVDQFGNSDDITIVYHVRNFLNPGLPFVSLEDRTSTNVDAILEVMKTIIDQCKAEGIFDPELDSIKATRLVLSIFSVIIDNIARVPSQSMNYPALIEEMTNTFQIIIRGFARDGIDRRCLDISVPVGQTLG